MLPWCARIALPEVPAPTAIKPLPTATPSRIKPLTWPTDFGCDLLVEPVGRALGLAAVVGEDQGRAVLADQLEHPRDDRRPDRAAGQGAEVVHDGFDLQVQWLFVAGVDDGHRPRL